MLICLIKFLFVLCISLEVSASKCSQPSLSMPSRQVRSNERLRGIRSPNETDFVVGILIPVHSPLANSSGGRCSNSLAAQGVQWAEVSLYAIDCINDDPNLLPNVTLGYDIRDTCNSENIALDETLDILVRDTRIQLEDTTPDVQKVDSFLLGIVGSATSAVSVPVATVLRLFEITQVSYLATSPLLNNRDRYSYFMRTVPSDVTQAAAMYYLALKFNWTLVSAIYSSDVYGSFAIREFRQLSVENDRSVCIDFSGVLDPAYTEDEYEQVVARLLKESKAEVVILFSAINEAIPFLEVLERKNTSRNFLFLASDTIADSPTTITRFRNLLNGMFAFHPLSEPYQQFESFYAKVTEGNNKRNHGWYSEGCKAFFEQRNLTCTSNSSIGRHPEYVQDVSGGLLVDAIYSLAHGLDQFLKDNCQQPVVWNRMSQTCLGQNNTLTRHRLLEYVHNSNFTSPTGFQVVFDENGNRGGPYSIFNLHVDGTNRYDLSLVGTYDRVERTIQLQKMPSDINFGQAGKGGEIVSQCTRCGPGSIFVRVQGSCCGTCRPCLGNSSASGNNSCTSCGEYQWGNEPLIGSTSCIGLLESDNPKRVRYLGLQPGDIWGATIVALSILGLILVIATTIGLGMFWNTRVIKSSGREQMVLLLLGILLSFLLPYFYVVKPSVAICVFQRSGIWLCFSLIFGALLVKLIRISRIFLQQIKAVGRPRFIEPQYQVLFTALIVAGQMTLVVISLVVVHPLTTIDVRSNEEDSNDFPTLILTCQTSHLAMVILLVVYDTALVVLNNVLAVITIRFPENFNEARHVAFSTIAFGVVWLVYVPSYFSTPAEFRAGVTAFAVITTAFAVLLCLFGPRIIMAAWHWWKERSKNGSEKNISTVDSSLKAKWIDKNNK